MLIATAGHIDHGKTALVRALTGAETDRLPEERARGISIDIGFAYWSPEGGGTIGFVDVPGHERFVRNMLAGAASVDFALLVVAADDGVMPQTVEHVEILDLLGITRGIVAITKADLVSPERIESVRAQVTALLARTGLAEAPLHTTSASTGAGIEDLASALLAARAAEPERGGANRAFRMPIDRAFTVTGAGTVVTGTIVDGAVRVGDRLTLAPLGRTVRVRGMHAAARSIEQAAAGTRAALNLTGIDLDEVRRGDWLLAQHNGSSSGRLDIRLRMLPAAQDGLRHNSHVHLHHGTADIPARVLLPGRTTIAPGEQAVAHVILDHQTSASVGDRIVLRDQAGRRTLGGGVVVDPMAPARRRRDMREAVWRALSAETPDAALSALLESAGQEVELRDFQRRLNLSPEGLADVLGQVLPFTFGAPPGRAISARAAETASAAALELLIAFHSENPRAAGMRQAELVAALPGSLSRDAIQALLRSLSEKGSLVSEGAFLRLSGFRPQADNSRAKAWADLLAAASTFETSSFGIPELARVLGQPERQVTETLTGMRGNGDIWRVSDSRFLSRAQVYGLADAARALSEGQPEGFTAADLRDRTPFGRNLLIEVLEFFDRIGLTRRSGNLRHVRADPGPILARAAQLERSLPPSAYLPTAKGNARGRGSRR